jgi:hypothetical protein
MIGKQSWLLEVGWYFDLVVMLPLGNDGNDDGDDGEFE